ncbi:MAG: hypothetical protein IPP88_22210 [Betaproteobacteria bacterium]|nr:hypothetical protein [Betaproteobacteria bacterium]
MTFTEQRQLYHRQHHAHRACPGGCTVTATKAADTNYNQATATVAVTTSLNAADHHFGANPGPVTYGLRPAPSPSRLPAAALRTPVTLVPPPAVSAPPAALTAPP